jgi:hypothetical protein
MQQTVNDQHRGIEMQIDIEWWNLIHLDFGKVCIHFQEEIFIVWIVITSYARGVEDAKW